MKVIVLVDGDYVTIKEGRYISLDQKNNLWVKDSREKIVAVFNDRDWEGAQVVEQ